MSFQLQNDANLLSALEVAVTTRIAEYQAAGGPCDADYERMHGPRSRPVAGKDESQPLLGNYAQQIAEKSDVLMMGGGRKGEAAQVFGVLADGLAIMAFAPGGVAFMGLIFNVSGEHRAWGRGN